MQKIHGFWPWPGASAVYISHDMSKSLRVNLVKASVIEHCNPDNLKSGTLDDNLNIICGKNALNVLEIKPAGKSLMAFKDFANGRRTKPGDSFAKIEL